MCVFFKVSITPKQLWYEIMIFWKYGVKNDAFSPSKNENFGGCKVRIAIFEDKMVIFI